MIYLASASPRRREILTNLGFTVSVHPADVDETPLPHEDPVTYAIRTARDKAATGPEHAVVLAADTVVHFDGAILHKPTDNADAASHLRQLSGRTHAVTTGVCIRRGSDLRSFGITTKVVFRSLDDREIEAYVATGEADDKAGAYGIQGRGGMLIAHVGGSWTNVMGLPAEAVVKPLLELGAIRWVT
jgi:septum formation protein